MTSIRRATRVVTARPWLTAAVVIIVAGAATGFTLLTSGGSSSSAAAATTSRLVDVTTGTVSKSVSTTGDLEPTVDDDVSFSSSATITSVRVTQGEKVVKGQILGTIDDLSLKATLATARATLADAQATLSDAEDSSDTTSTQLAADKAQVTSAAQAVTSARTALTDATLRAPVAGIVAAVNVTKGDQSSGSSSSSASGSSGGSSSSTDSSGSGSSNGSSASTTSSTSSSSGDFEIIGTATWQVTVDVDDTEIGLLATGQQAQLTTDNHTGTIFGTVTAVSVLSSSSSGSASYPVTVTVTGTPTGLHDGAEATVEIIYEQADNAIVVPTAALHRDGTSTYVYLSSAGKRVKQIVTVGLAGSGTTQITAGLKSGQQVYEDVATPASTGTSGRSGSSNSGGTGGFPGGGFGGGSGGGFGGGSGGGTSGGFGGGFSGGGS